VRTIAQDGEPELATVASHAIAAVRKAKSVAHLSMRADVLRVLVEGPTSGLDQLRTVSGDVKAAGHIGEFVYREDAEAEELRVSVELC
jgi:valyl-tRNA synthetase